MQEFFLQLFEKFEESVNIVGFPRATPLRLLVRPSFGIPDKIGSTT
jgi:hypothetical protein